ncbi:hemerythrin superfamily protein [Streptosporangium becharense]|uniref:Hemerythrin superfamily protein n=1 Tax=Streptosporangium becharense TaxID=1816182 RepID=A0A7W9IHQ1_9ACTN|nr:hemerythrin domain-containing protein [Streptosporangium becharense]MBB2914664.1 hemerythrin superfamily protein [Streptosporangium becharense]MBB5820935.1 hemerythrin superfamily protein [Streptosporangium becharense]
MSDRQTVPELMDDTDVVDLLLRQHALIRDLFDEVEEAPAADRGEAFQRLVRMLAVHETAEEEIVHPYARRKLDGGDSVVDDRLAEENEAKQLLMQMDKAGPGAPQFMTNLAMLRAAVLAHARSEERYEFTQLRAQTSEAERRAMAAGVKAAEAMAPTHPHPGTESATKNLLLGTPIAIMDRARDVIRQAMGKEHG